jgi:Gly-Xaa carboxypeptidase
MTDNSSAIESLLEAKFKPRRSVVLAFGFDEESSGFEVSFSTHVHRPEPFLKRNALQGAGTLGLTLEDAYGENGFAMIVDEGCKMTSCLYFTLDTKRKALGFSRIH